MLQPFKKHERTLIIMIQYSNSKYGYDIYDPEDYQKVLNNYKEVSYKNFPKSDDWHMIVKRNKYNDYKYGRIAISNKLKMRRQLTMDEFYCGETIWD